MIGLRRFDAQGRHRDVPLVERLGVRARHGLDAPDLVALFAWSEEEFLEKTAGSAIRRIGHERWLRNIAVALGNAPPDPAIRAALEARLDHPSEIVREHVGWAVAQQSGPKTGGDTGGASEHKPGSIST